MRQVALSHIYDTRHTIKPVTMHKYSGIRKICMQRSVFQSRETGPQCFTRCEMQQIINWQFPQKTESPL